MTYDISKSGLEIVSEHSRLVITLEAFQKDAGLYLVVFRCSINIIFI